MLGSQQSVGGGVFSIWDRARLPVVILLPRVPTALPVDASKHVQFYLLFPWFPPAAGLCGVGSRLIDANRQVRQHSGQDCGQELT